MMNALISLELFPNQKLIVVFFNVFLFCRFFFRYIPRNIGAKGARIFADVLDTQNIVFTFRMPNHAVRDRKHFRLTSLIIHYPNNPSIQSAFNISYLIFDQIFQSFLQT